MIEDKELPEPEYVITYSDMPPLGEHKMSEAEIIKYMIDNRLPAHSCSCGCIEIKTI